MGKVLLSMLLGVGLLVLVIASVGVSSHNDSSNRTVGEPPQPQTSQVSNIPKVTPANVETSTLPNEITTPTLISQPQAEYGEEPRRNKLNGTVKLVLTVDEEGNPQNVMVVKSLGMDLDECAVGTVKRYKFHPAVDRRTGKPVPAQMSVNLDFRLD